jgi:hypothetical protein
MVNLNLGYPLELHPFSPPWWLCNGHAQTLAANFWTGPAQQYRAVPRRIVMEDGDAVVVHDDCPSGWRPGERAVLLMHGLIGSHLSPLLVRLASKLTDRGVRVFRWDFRGCGAGTGLARLPYHAGCSQDLAKVVDSVIGWCETIDSPQPTGTGRAPGQMPSCPPFLTLFGVSLSGNILLKYLGESPGLIPGQVCQAIAVNPPIDLARSIETLNGTINRWYDRHFVGALMRDVQQRKRLRPDAPMPARWQRPRRLLDFDDWYTAPMSGFFNAKNYYERCSALQFMSGIQVPTTVITSQDDPMVPIEMFTETVDRWSPCARLAIVNGGGHVGYIARRCLDPDQFWLDWRVVDLVTHQTAG